MKQFALGGRSVRSIVVILSLVLFGAGLPVLADDEAELSLTEKAALGRAVGKWRQEMGGGKDNVRTSASKRYVPVDENTYTVTAHVDTANQATLDVERYRLTLTRVKPEVYEVTAAEVELEFKALRREMGHNCYPFDKFSFDEEGLTMSGSKGWMCEAYYDNDLPKLGYTPGHLDVVRFSVVAPDLAYDYMPPPYVDEELATLRRFLDKDHKSELVFDPKGLQFLCDPLTCDDLISRSFTGLERVSPTERTHDSAGEPADMDQAAMEFLDGEINENTQEITPRSKLMKDSEFAWFTTPYFPGRKYYKASVVKNDRLALGLEFDSWDGYEVKFGIVQDSADPEAMRGLIFGYYSKETMENTTPYEREQRDDLPSRFHEVYSLKGEVDVALEDPEMLEADVTFGLTIKQETDVLPFFIASVPNRQTGEVRSRALSVNSIVYQGEELSWVRTGPISGLIAFPDTIPAGTKIEIDMNFATRAIAKMNYAFSQMSRFGWLPFVRFADFIDEFEMTIRSPSQYEILGIGGKVSDEVQGDVRVSHWKAESPVVFPTIIFGKYISDRAKFDAKKADGTVIPVEVHVDEVSMNQLDMAVQTAQQAEEFGSAIRTGARGIRGKQLRPIAEQAANSINLYTEISGVEYPYAELNLVNDPAPALYGQAPSSLIYLGSLVFRGEGTMAGDDNTGIGGGGAGTAKFLKSVTAHEVGHQWWGSRISNANQRNYWFVETLAEYFSAIYLEASFGKDEYHDQLDEWRRRVLSVDSKTSVQRASTHWSGNFPGSAYQAAVYNKGPYMFHLLREMFGDEKFFDYLKKFTMQLADQQEIVSRDIQQASEKHLGGVDPNGNPYNVDLEWFFDQWLRGSGLPQYKFTYDVRQAEDGSYIVEGTIRQRVIVGNSREYQVMEGVYYRGVVDVTALTKGGEEYKRRVVIDGAETPFRVKVPEKPLEVDLNKYGETLSHEVKVNQDW